MYNFNDKVVLVTGGANGIGAGIVRAVLEKDPKHVAVLDINPELGKALEEEQNAKYGDNRVRFIKCDVTKDLDAAFEETVQNFGYIDVVINNAGILNEALDAFEKEIEINLIALITSSLKAYNMMHLQQGAKGGTIINVASTVALFQSHLSPIYSGTKSGVIQFSNCLGMKQNYDRSGVRVVTVCFGATDTNLIKGKIGVIDPALEPDIVVALQHYPSQKVETAAQGLTEAYERGASGSTWLVTCGRQAEDITETVKKAYEILSKGVF